MIPQELNERIEIQELTDTRSSTGQKVGGWIPFGQRWAKAIPKGSSRFEKLSASIDGVTVIFEMYGRLAVTPQMRVMHRDRAYRIVGLTTNDNREPLNADEITLICSGMQ